jgi:hypothetical protein
VTGPARATVIGPGRVIATGPLQGSVIGPVRVIAIDRKPATKVGAARSARNRPKSRRGSRFPTIDSKRLHH